MEFLRTFGNNVKKYRKMKRLSQEELAYRLSINFSNISRIESGKQFVTAEVLQSISNILGITANKLFETEEKSNASKKTANNTTNSYKEKLINYISVLSEEDAKYIFESAKLYTKYKIKRN